LSSSSAKLPGKPAAKTTGLHVGAIRPGVPKVDPIITIDNVSRKFGGLVAVDVEHLEIPRGPSPP
jgi:neutral amino acid transport system ATP-binding protein